MNKELVPAPEAFDLFQFSKSEYLDAVARIMKHRQSTIKFQSLLSSANGATLREDYSFGRISHNYFSKSTFDGASLEGVAGAGSIFIDVIFQNTNLKGSNFQNSTFDRCRFDDCELDGSNMGASYFNDTQWTHCPIGRYNISNSYFKNCEFIETVPGNLADSVLDSVSFESVRIANTNIEFSSFRSISTKDSVLAFSQLPYVFNGLQYIFETSDNIRISSKINSQNSISVQEYADVLHDMVIFYSYNKEYFPLANILLAFQNYEESLSVLLRGVMSATYQRDFRMCKYYCKLLTENGHFNANTLSDFYQKLYLAAPMQSLSEPQYYQYRQHMPDIREMLLENPENYPHASLSLVTEINASDSENIVFLLEVLDNLLHLRCSSIINQSISIAHNSPPVYLIPLCGPAVSILAISALVLTVISKVCKSYNDFAQAIINTQKIQNNIRQKKRDELETRKLEHEIANLELENEDLKEKIAAYNQQMKNRGIVIAQASFTPEDFYPMPFLK